MTESRTIRAVRITEHGGIERLDVVELAEPRPGPGEVAVRAVASSINPVDWKTRAWDIGPAMPMVLGWDLAGIVVGGTAGGFETGDRVVAMSAQLATGLGTWAETVVLPARLVAPAPRSVPLAEAATLPLAGLTARQSLADLDLPAGARLLVTGAAGAVGGLVAQLALAAGYRVDGLVSRPEHVPPARELGLGSVVTELSALPADGYDAVFDSAGVHPGKVLRDGGAYLSISDDPLPPVPGAHRIGVQEDGAGLAELAALVDRGLLRLRVARRYALRDVRAAHHAFEAGGLVGKVVIEF
ncbi:MAG TPA: NADP-dependent oxidoreductase [Actinocatenispora sp.]